ncbi:MAG TPA: TIGR03621 family F420-dependent LLM class oxidoreductase [Solirubrobacteraceae bacterium]|jgi:probable F420-dependent oxidoreductase
MRPIRFGVEMMAPFEGRTWAESARDLEELGYSTLFVPDHFDEGYGPITAMATAAAATTSLRVASAVFAVDFRHPAVLARELASIDALSEGRLEVGLGAGYQVADYRAPGIPMDGPGTRVSRLIEYVEVLRGLFSDGAFDFAGTQYTIAGLDGTPRPHTAGGPPIFVAGGGRRMLTFAAQHADIVGVNPSLPTSARAAEAARDAVPERIDEKFGWVRDAAGARIDEIEFHAWLRHAEVTDDAHAAIAPLAAAMGVSGDTALESPVALVGSVQEIVERLQLRRERWGYTYYTVQQPAAHVFSAVLEELRR